MEEISRGYSALADELGNVELVVPCWQNMEPRSRRRVT